MSDYKCPSCGNKPSKSEDLCATCGAQLVSPNVRACQTSEEIKALDKRVAAAEADCQSRECLQQLTDFAQAVNSSEAVVCRPLSKVKELVSSDSPVYGTFYLEVEASTRRPAENAFDQVRGTVDEKFFPLYKNQIRFAALSLDGQGPLSYGGTSITLNTNVIKNRASLFEENTFVFTQKYELKIMDPVPVGYRAVWDDKGKLAAAKLYLKVNPATSPDQYSKLLLENNGATDADDFIEVNIFGPFNRKSIKKITFGPVNRLDKPLQKSIIKILEQEKIGYEEMTARAA